MNLSACFPELEARDLTGRDVVLPSAFDGSVNLVFVAFRRQQQAEIDSWGPWLENTWATEVRRFYEVPALARLWAPARNFIDGGMATGVGSLETQQRTFTVYGDLNRVTRPLAINDRSVVSIFIVNANGLILDRATGRFDPAVASRLLTSADV